jgi:hypothetical protein
MRLAVSLPPAAVAAEQLHRLVGARAQSAKRPPPPATGGPVAGR